MPNSKVLPKANRSVKSNPPCEYPTDGNTMKQASQSKGLSYEDGRTTTGNVLSQANQPKGGKLYPKTPGDASGYSLGSLTKKEAQ